MTKSAMDISREHAQLLDSRDPLARFRTRFYQPLDGSIYLDGNSLGLLSVDAEQGLLTALAQWKHLAINGWLAPESDWFTLGERAGAMMARLVGARSEEVVVSGTTTLNLHALVSTFYQPTITRRKIVATELDFPSDIYALQSQIMLRGGEPERDLVQISSRDGGTIDENDIVDAMTPDVSLCLLPSVLYRSGQLLDIERIAAVGQERRILVGWDCAHSVGAIPHEFDRWNVDFAFWCAYKYLNAGPGSVGALYVNHRHFQERPGLAGWWGYQKERQFDMAHEWQGAGSAAAWQISTVPVLSAAAVIGAMQIHLEADIDAIREKSLAQTQYLADLLTATELTDSPYHYRIGSPLTPECRGGHLAIEHDFAASIARCLKQRGVIPDFRAPNVVRLAPVALYTTYEELWLTVNHLREIIDSGEHLKGEQGRSLVA